MASTNRNNPVPGRANSQGEKNMYSRPSFSISPQLGVGACTPKPRKDSAASSKMALAISTVATTVNEDSTLGKISRMMIYGVEQPMARAAFT